MMPRCRRCGGVWHPATGALYEHDVPICGTCERAFWAWAAKHTATAKRVGPRNQKPARFLYFYEHTKAATWKK